MVYRGGCAGPKASSLAFACDVASLVLPPTLASRRTFLKLVASRCLWRCFAQRPLPENCMCGHSSSKHKSLGSECIRQKGPKATRRRLQLGTVHSSSELRGLPAPALVVTVIIVVVPALSSTSTVILPIATVSMTVPGISDRPSRVERRAT